MLVFDFFWLFVLRCAIVLQLFIITNQNKFAYDIVYIPQRLILTKVDNLDLCGNGDVSGVFRSRHAQQKVQQVKEKFVLHDCQFLPVDNYIRESAQNIKEDVLALLAMNNIIEESLAYIENEV